MLMRYLEDISSTVEYEAIPITPQAEKIPKSFPCEEYVIKAQVLAGGRGKGHFDNGFKVILWSNLGFISRESHFS